ncbi:hypothetical protein BDV33DRAFT_193818 [Aspergillus novoparasiticus]|uniref:Zn(2)-C6 fungal-type domain-containing protein n=1 Tax=Aspergillus novoparasiticus TaxID=986946 RepID=A0A5N6EIT2_9EURO|nr:hypothetical protein BDV33DRAFT_193818 [Aspergillus novoparasiticus]
MPRRAHTKSRNGCDQCKKRRVKCDEKGPPCSNCVTRELRCSYLNTPAARSIASSSSASPNSIHPGQGQTSDEGGHPFAGVAASVPFTYSRKRELELMHKFSTDTYRSLCNKESDHYVWRIVMPRKALEHDFLMSGILAVASLHTASALEPPEALSYIDTALEYHNQGLAPFRHAITNLTPFNCDAVFAHSVITIMICIALPRLPGSRGESSSMTENLIFVFELLKGVAKIFTITRSWLENNLFASKNGFYEKSVAPLDAGTEAALTRLADLNDTLLSSVEPDQHSIIKDAISHLHRCFARYAHEQDAASVLSWLAGVDKEFVHVVCRRQPLALLVLMHWGVLLAELDGKTWWARKSGSALVSEILIALQAGDARWEEAVLWPKQKLGL